MLPSPSLSKSPVFNKPLLERDPTDYHFVRMVGWRTSVENA